MEHISLYRKWRPQTFSDVVGQRHVTNTLANALSSDRLVHAYLFCGPRGTGKTSTARILAKAVNCVEGPTATPCNVCEACTSISAGTALDVIEIDAASNRKIDEIRELLDKIPYMPTSLRSKVYIIDEVHQLTEFAASALLKTLEEPPAHVIFVLATTEPQDLLPTIVSRCQRYDFSLVQAQEISRLLGHIAASEGIDIDNEAIEMIAEHAHGSVRDAIGVIDQISNLAPEHITRGQLADLIGEVETELVFKMVDLLAERDTPGALALIGNMVDSGKEPSRFTESLITHLRNMFLIQNAANPSEIVEATTDHFQRLQEQSESLSRHEVIKLMERLGETHRQMRWSENPRLILECAVVKNTSLDADISLEGLSFRIEQLERKIELLGEAGGAQASAEGGTERHAGKIAGTRAAKDEVVSGAVEAVREAAPDRDGKAGGAAKSVGGPGEVSPKEDKAGTAEAKRKGAKPRAPRQSVENHREAPVGAGARGSEKEKVRRAWMAVLGELKKMGQMKLYALLTKARVQGMEEGALVLGFPEDALFQMQVLDESKEDIAAIEEMWERFVGEPVRVKTVSLAAGSERKATSASRPKRKTSQAETDEVQQVGEAAHTAAGVETAGDAPADSGASRVGSKGERPQTGAATAEGKGQKPAEPQKASPDDIAKLLKERFDGEIIDKKKEGKD
jgi:DNA polymerase III subunit gamma/tau